MIKESPVFQVGDDKIRRGTIHKLIRENFTNLESSTIDKDGQKYIKVLPGSSNKGMSLYLHLYPCHTYPSDLSLLSPVPALRFPNHRNDHINMYSIVN